MKFLPKANQIRAVTVRDLMRNSAETFDLIENGEPILLIRHGRPIATIQPLEQAVVRRAMRQRREAEAESKEVPEPLPDLTDVQWTVLEAVAKREYPDDLLTLVHLELQGFVTKTMYGWEPTLKGLEALDARSEHKEGGALS